MAVSVGVALAAGSDEGPDGPVPSASSTLDPVTEVPADTGGGTGGTVTGGGDSGGTDAEPDPDATDPVPTPTPSADLDEINRRITELGAKVDQLPTKQELADALRAFADQLDSPTSPTSAPTQAPSSDPDPS
ncbi:hypothetical protein OG352_19795 [Streptomyces sp. NBC_01485]|uniref:hypothetical protein n=1 Tax=Streptomyces sp. NBC_01485 TaxID=2903884 RepID=UPI002E30C8FE|nr:hypothetical protein [Streptomyces sp. NBC_01485]